jgi:hypothetical protein
MQTLKSISKRYQINQYGESYFTLTLTDLTTGKETAAQVFGDLESIVSTMDASVYGIDPEADPAQYRAVISSGKTELAVMPTCDGPDNAIVTYRPASHAYEIREIDAIAYDDGWTYNTTYRLGEFTTAGDVPRAFRRALAKMGIQFYRGRTVTEYDGDVYEICDRATHEPLFAAIPKEA